MRYTVEYQHTTQKWVIFDTQTFMMLGGSYRTEEQAYMALFGIEESARQRRSQTSTSVRVA
jgi:hypothetical protein